MIEMPVYEGRHADVARAIHGQGVEALKVAAAGNEPAALRGRPRVAPDLAGSVEVERPEPGRLGFGDVERVAVGRQANAVGRDHGKRDLPDQAAIGAGIADRAAVHFAVPALAEVGEVEAAVAVEHQVVRTAQRRLVACGVERLHGASGEVHALDPAAAIVVGLQDRTQPGFVIGPLEATVVADGALAVGTDRRPVRAARELRHDVFGPVRLDAEQRAALDLHQQDGAVGHGDRAFGETEPGRDLTQVHRAVPWDREGMTRCSRIWSICRSNIRYVLS